MKYQEINLAKNMKDLFGSPFLSAGGTEDGPKFHHAIQNGKQLKLIISENFHLIFSNYCSHA